MAGWGAPWGPCEVKEGANVRACVTRGHTSQGGVCCCGGADCWGTMKYNLLSLQCFQFSLLSENLSLVPRAALGGGLSPECLGAPDSCAHRVLPTEGQVGVF